jgi:hypothetical protein
MSGSGDIIARKFSVPRYPKHRVAPTPMNMPRVRLLIAARPVGPRIDAIQHHMAHQHPVAAHGDARRHAATHPAATPFPTHRVPSAYGPKRPAHVRHH